MDLELSGKKALITGGSRGIGRRMRWNLPGRGVDIAIAARDRIAGRCSAGYCAHYGSRHVSAGILPGGAHRRMTLSVLQKLVVRADTTNDDDVQTLLINATSWAASISCQ